MHPLNIQRGRKLRQCINHNLGPGLLQNAISKLDGQLDDNKTNNNRQTTDRQTNDDRRQDDGRQTTDNSNKQQMISEDLQKQNDSVKNVFTHASERCCLLVQLRPPGLDNTIQHKTNPRKQANKQTRTQKHKNQHNKDTQETMETTSYGLSKNRVWGTKNSVKSSRVVCTDIHENHTDENSANHASSCRMNDSVASRLAKARWSQARAPSERADAQHGKELLSLWGALMLCHQVTRVFRPR